MDGRLLEDLVGLARFSTEPKVPWRTRGLFGGLSPSAMKVGLTRERTGCTGRTPACCSR